MDFVESFKIKKIFPNTIKIEIYEKKPIAILQKKKEDIIIQIKMKL